ncbi:unnamed protein product [Brassica oleracea]
MTKSSSYDIHMNHIISSQAMFSACEALSTLLKSGILNDVEASSNGFIAEDGLTTRRYCQYNRKDLRICTRACIRCKIQEQDEADRTDCVTQEVGFWKQWLCHAN